LEENILYINKIFFVMSESLPLVS